MSFGDAAARFKKISADDATHPQVAIEQEPVDLNEVYALRARMLGVLIRDVRAASGYSIEEIAAQVAVDPQTLVEWEFGHQAPSLPQLELLAYFLKVPISHFWGTETLAQQQSRRTVDSYEYLVLRTHMVGAMVRAKREAEHLTLEMLASQIGVAVETLQAFEMGQIAVPMTILVSLASILRVNLDHFLVDGGRVGEFFDLQEAVKVLASMSPDVREFVSVPKHEAYIRLAMTLANLPTDDLRKLAEGLLDITL